jgi:hypothetical protein
MNRTKNMIADVFIIKQFESFFSLLKSLENKFIFSFLSQFSQAIRMISKFQLFSKKQHLCS